MRVPFDGRQCHSLLTLYNDSKQWVPAMRISLATLLLVMLAACGGGGGGGTSPTVPPPPAPPVGGGTLVLNADNAEAVVLGVTMTEASLQFAQTVVDAVTDFIRPGGGPFIECYNNGGSKSAVHADNDSDFFVSAGDVLTIHYVDCYERGINDLVNGTITISIDEFDASPTGLSLNGAAVTDPGFTITDEFDASIVIDVSADAAFSFVDDSSETLELRLEGAQQLSFVIAGAEESVTEAVFRKVSIPPPAGSSDPRWSTEIAVQEKYDSDLLGGSMTCASTQFDFAPFNTSSPSVIAFQCTGLNRTAVRIVGSGGVEVDDDGNGSFTYLGDLIWSEVIEGFLGHAFELDLTELLGQIPVGFIQVSANDVFYDAVNGRLLLTANADDARFPNSLVAIDGGTGVPAQLVSFAAEPGLVRVSADGALIYVTFADSGIVHRYASSDNQLQDSIELRADPAVSDSENILDIDISPADSNTFAALFRFSPFVRHDIALVSGTSQLDNTYYDVEPGNSPDVYERLSFSSDGTTVIADARTLLSHDATGFTSVYKSRLGVAADFQRVGDTLHAGPVALDESTLVRKGEYPANGSQWVFDQDSNFALFYSGSTLHVALLDQHSLAARYGLDLNLQGGDDVSKMVSGGGRIYMLSNSLINVINLADIEIQTGEDCAATVIMTADDEPYTNYGCSVRAAAYDPVRSKLYLGLSDSEGENGNSVAVIDAVSGDVEAFTRVDARPSQMVMAGDGSKLFISFSTADRIAELNPDTLLVDRAVPIPLWAPGSVSAEARPRVATDLHASPIDSELVVVSAGIGYHTQNLEEYRALRSGAWLPDSLARNSRGSSQNRVLGFDSSGALFDVARDLNGYVVEEYAAGVSGLTGVSSGQIARPSLFSTLNAISDGEATVINGDSIDLGTLSYTGHFDMAAAPGIAQNGNTAEYVFIDEANGHTYFAYMDSTLVVPHIRVARFASDSGQYEASEAFEGTIDRSAGNPFLEVGNDQIAILLTGSLGAILLDKSSIN